ncbi:PucR family transcriptional regulator [Clostridium sp. HCP1S3_B4]|uniref:PucR family transcriptional regulator n=1 Tax=unclassified Clostridium TaxID=2614128 RepID=UPI003F8BDB88
MSIVLEKVIKDSQNLYNMKLIAGEKGLKNIVQWVHVVEEYNMNSFLGGNEIILTTGIACDNGHSLLDFVKMLYKCDVSAIIVNIGPHIHEVTKDVIDYCNEKSVPIFTMPWEVRIEEVTRDFCRKIVNNENIEKNIVSIFKDMIFEYEDYVIGVGSLKINLGDISKEFKKTIEVVKLGNKTDKNVIYYDEIGIYKILLEAKASNVLNDFYKDILEPIEKYDKENNTSMIEFIKKYLENNGSVQAVAEAMFVHRNTVNYQINKIKKITGKDLGDLEVKLSFLLCTYIKNIL